MFKFFIFLIVLYFYVNLTTYNNDKYNNYNNYKIDLLIEKVVYDKYITNQEKNRLYNYIDYKLSKNYNETKKWLFIKDKLDIQ